MNQHMDDHKQAQTTAAYFRGRAAGTVGTVSLDEATAAACTAAAEAIAQAIASLEACSAPPSTPPQAGNEPATPMVGTAPAGNSRADQAQEPQHREDAKRLQTEVAEWHKSLREARLQRAQEAAQARAEFVARLRGERTSSAELPGQDEAATSPSATENTSAQHDPPITEEPPVHEADETEFETSDAMCEPDLDAPQGTANLIGPDLPSADASPSDSYTQQSDPRIDDPSNEDPNTLMAPEGSCGSTDAEDDPERPPKATDAEPVAETEEPDGGKQSAAEPAPAPAAENPNVRFARTDRVSQTEAAPNSDAAQAPAPEAAQHADDEGNLTARFRFNRVEPGAAPTALPGSGARVRFPIVRSA